MGVRPDHFVAVVGVKFLLLGSRPSPSSVEPVPVSSQIFVVSVLRFGPVDLLFRTESGVDREGVHVVLQVYLWSAGPPCLAVTSRPVPFRRMELLVS